MQRVTVKTSTILIAKGGRTRVYRSMQEIPQRLRKQLEDSTNGFNSTTMLIVDRRGRGASAGLEGLAVGLAHARVSSMQSQTLEQPPVAACHSVLQFLPRNWLEILLPGAVGAVLWLAFNYR
jgi:hypothetical protein